MMTQIDEKWLTVLEILSDRRESILHQELYIDGVKKMFDKPESTFWIGKLKCDLTKKGWKFQVFE